MQNPGGKVQLPSVARPLPPLWRQLRDDMEHAGISVRQMARILAEKDPRQTESSWARSLARYRAEESETVPSPETARLLARILKQPRDKYLRPTSRETLLEENRRLRAENERLLRVLREGRAGGGRGGGQS